MIRILFGVFILVFSSLANACYYYAGSVPAEDFATACTNIGIFMKAGGYATIGHAVASGNSCAVDGYQIPVESKQCAPPSCPPNGTKQNYQWTTNTEKTSICFNSCSWNAGGVQAHSDADGGGGAGEFFSSGQNCTGGNTGTPDPGSCPKGTHNISANPFAVNCTSDKPPPPTCWAGSTNVSTDPTIAICVPNKTPDPNAPPNTPSTPDNPASHVPDTTKPPVVNTTEVTEVGSDGTKTTTKTTTTTTTNTDGSQSIGTTKTLTAVAPDGTTKTTTDKAGVGGDDGKDFCKSNPTLNICKNSSIVATCTAFSCDGDAISCRIAKETQESNCRMAADATALAASPQAAIANQIIAGNDPLKATFPNEKAPSVVNIGSTQLDSSGFLGAGSCFSDKTFSISGRSVVVPFSKVCDYLTPLRLAVMLMALMASYRMIAGTILRDI